MQNPLLTVEEVEKLQHFDPQVFAKGIQLAFLEKLRKDPTAWITYKGTLLHEGDPKVLEHSEPIPLYQLQVIQDLKAVVTHESDVAESFKSEADELRLEVENLRTRLLAKDENLKKCISLCESAIKLCEIQTKRLDRERKYVLENLT